MAVIAYIRVSTDKQDTINQRLEILEHARRQGIIVNDFVEIEISSRQNQKKRRIEELLTKLGEGDTAITSELSRLGRSTAEVIDLVNTMIQRKISLIAVKQGLNITGQMDMQTKVVVTMFSLFSELERDLISQRTKNGLAAKKAAGMLLGKPKGTLQTSMLDEKREAIEELIKHRVAKAAIARMMKTSRTNLNAYIKSRGL